MNKFIVYPYSMKSSSAKLLSSELGTHRVYPDRAYRYSPGHVIINWGCSKFPDWWHVEENIKCLNEPHNVRISCSKIFSFTVLTAQGVNTPDWTNNPEEVNSWLECGHKVFARTLVNSHGGKGIVILKPDDPIIQAPLYTKEIKKDKEYRVHVFKDSVFDFVQKKKKSNFMGVFNNEIRNHNNGWVFAREDVILPDSVEVEAIKAVKSIGLDFGAVDICTEKDTGKAFVLEVNTAPGIVETTLRKYAEVFNNYLRSL